MGMLALSIAIAFAAVLWFISKRSDSNRVAATPSKSKDEQVRPKVFENVYAAAKRLEGSLDVGVNKAKYHELLQGLASELSIATGQELSSAEKQIAELYQETLTTYRDAEDIWDVETEICAASRADFEIMIQLLVREKLIPAFPTTTTQSGSENAAQSGKEDDRERVFFLTLKNLKSITAKYQLPTVSKGVVAKDYAFISSKSTSILWECAQELTKKARALCH